MSCPDKTNSTVATSRRTRSKATPSTQPDTTSPSLPQCLPKTSHDSNTSESSGTPATNSESVSPHEFKKIFNGIYQRFYNLNKISIEDEKQIFAQEVDLDEFDRLTERKQYARYISLIDGRIIFHEVPNTPHGQIIDCLVFSINAQIDRTMFIGAVDNGRITQIPSLQYRLYFRYTPYQPI